MRVCNDDDDVCVDVRSGQSIMPMHTSPFGKLSGAICFDLDFPRFIHQAGVKKVGEFI